MTVVDQHHAPAENWRKTLYILFVAQMITAVGFSTIFPFLPLYVESLGASTSLSIEFLAGAVFSVQAFTMMLASPIWGAIADRYGRKLMVERAMFGGAVLLLLMGFARTAEELVLLRAIQGLITGTVAAANALIGSIAPRRQMGYAMGLLQVGLGAGVALGPLIGGAIADVYGYSAAFYGTAGLMFISGILVWYGVEEEFTPPENQESSKTSIVANWRHVFATPGVIVTFSLRFLSQLGRMIMVPIMPLFIQTLLISADYLNTFTGLVIGVASATTTVSAVFLGRLGDRSGHRRILVICASLAAVLYLAQSQVNAGWQLLVFQGLVGVCMGGIIPAISAMLANQTESGEMGAVYGLDNSINAAGRSVAPMLGSLVAVSFNMRAVFLATAILFLGTGIMALKKLPHDRPQSSPNETFADPSG